MDFNAAGPTAVKPQHLVAAARPDIVDCPCGCEFTDMWVSLNAGFPQNGGFNMDNPIKNADVGYLGVPSF